MKKIITIGLIVCFVFSLVGCASKQRDNAESLSTGTIETQTRTETEETKVMKDVTFFNYIEMYASTGENEGWSELEFQTVQPYTYPYDYTQENTLFAFYFSISFFDEKNGGELPEDYPVCGEAEDANAFEHRLKGYLQEKAVELLIAEGVYILNYDNPNTEAIAIAATSSQLERLFASEDSVFNDWKYHISPAVRFDFNEVAKGLGWSEENESIYVWYESNKENMQKEIGTEPHVTMSVEIE